MVGISCLGGTLRVPSPTARATALGIDVRGQGGYFIVAPSKREDGAAYGWENPPGLFDPVETPAWLWDLITARPEHKAASRVFAFGASSSGTRETAYARAALDGAAREVASAGAGQRNNTLNAIAYRLGRMIARGWLSRDEVEVRLLAAAHENGLVQDDGGFATQRTISSGLDAGMSNPHDELQDDRQFGAAYPKQPASVAVDENGEDDPRPPAFTDEALALRFAERHAGDLRYVAAWGRWLQYDGGRWDFDDTLLAFDRSRKLCREAAAECDRASTASSIASAKTVAAVERLAKADRRLAATIDQWDADLWLLNTPDGVIDLRTGEVRQHRREDYLTKMAAVSPGGNCPVWREHLLRVMNSDAETVAYLQRVFGYALTGSTREHALFFAYGTGANGKTVTVNAVANVLADYHRTASVETFTASNTDRHPTELAGLRGARLVTASETEQGRRWAESRIKSLTGGEKVEARFMRQDFFEFDAQLKLFIAGNHKPGLTSVDEAIRRRFHLIPFTVTIGPKNATTGFLSASKRKGRASSRGWSRAALRGSGRGLSRPPPSATPRRLTSKAKTFSASGSKTNAMTSSPATRRSGRRVALLSSGLGLITPFVPVKSRAARRPSRPRSRGAVSSLSSTDTRRQGRFGAFS